MKVIARSLVVIFVALIAVPTLAVTYTITAAVQLLATTALIMGGTQHPLSNPPDTAEFINEYMGLAETNYIIPATGATPDSRVAAIYPAEFFPIFGSTTFDDSVLAGRDNLNSCIRGGLCNGGAAIPRAPGDTFVVFGYSQSAVVASLVKQDLIEDPTGAPTNTEFVLDANPMRPNGGILGRGFEGLTIPFVGITFYGPTPNSCPTAEPCAGPYPTTDTAQQYDLLGGDAPAVPWNVLAWANSAAAYALLHGNVPNRSIAPGGGDPADPQVIYQGAYGDTDYYMITAPRLPLLMLPEMLGVPGPLLAVVDAPLRVLIEAGYYREASPGEHVPFQLLPEKDPITLVVNLAASIPVGIDDGLQEAGLGRALGTADVYRPFGVGGPTYNKVTGEPEPDSNILPLNAAPNSSGAQESLLSSAPPAPEPSQTGDTLKINTDPDADELGNDDTSDVTTPLEGTQPRPVELFRGPIKFDPPKLPSLRPNGEGPLKRLVNALTGQRPDPAGAPAPAEGEHEPAA